MKALQNGHTVTSIIPAWWHICFTAFEACLNKPLKEEWEKFMQDAVVQQTEEGTNDDFLDSLALASNPDRV